MSKKSLVLVPEIDFDEDKKALIREMYCKEGTPAQIAHFLEICKSRRLDPVLHQIHAVFRKNRRENKVVMSIQVGIDGLRSIASRTGEYAGGDEPVFELDDDGLPLKATVTVYRMVQGNRCAFTASAHWSEYAPDPSGPDAFMWKKMPRGQLSKCAEALALRKGFPGDLASLYEGAEFAKPDETGTEKAVTVQAIVEATPAPVVSESEYFVPIGPWAGKRISEIDAQALADYVASKRDEAQTTKKKIGGALKELIERAEKHLNEVVAIEAANELADSMRDAK